MTTQTTTQTATTPAPKAKTTKAKAAAPKAKAEAKTPAQKAKAEPKPHQPSTIASTTDNPAKSIVPVGFKKLYAAHDDTCGRPLALALKTYTTGKNADGRDALDVAKLQEVAKANGVNFSAYAHLNRGQQRMNVYNKLAGKLKRGESVVVGKTKFADPDKGLRAPAA